MAERLLPFATLGAYRDARGRKRFHRWNAVTHGCASHEQHLAWMKEQEDEIRHEAAYRKRVGMNARTGRVLRMASDQAGHSIGEER